MLRVYVFDVDFDPLFFLVLALLCEAEHDCNWVEVLQNTTTNIIYHVKIDYLL